MFWPTTREIDKEKIETRIEQFKTKQKDLMTTDMYITRGSIIAPVSYFLSFLPILPLNIISMAACAFTGWNLRARTELQQEYSEALDELLQVYQEVLPSGDKDNYYLLRDKTVQDLIRTIGPYLPVQEAVRWSAEDLEPGRMNRYQLEDDFRDFCQDLGAGMHTRSWHYMFYGHGQLQALNNTLLSYWNTGVDYVNVGTDMVRTRLANA